MKKIILSLLILSSISLLFGQSVETIKNQEKLNLHVPSPEWQDQIIYFLMIDRFNDGDTSNNNQGYGEYDPNDHRKFSGGDIKGVIDKLDYIKNLGATTVWITPPVANQWWDSTIQYGGYHGYWAENFKKVDIHFGDLKDYQLLSHHLHENGMYLIQDIVLNHTGNFFKYDGTYNPEDITLNYKKITNSIPVNTPSQYPFNMNDPNKPLDRAAAIYNWTPEISDYNDKLQRLKYQMADLDDINTNNIVVREVLRDSYGYWIHVVGVDGFRIDTIIYVELDFWPDFMNAESTNAPGINQVAAQTGRDNFIAFGETFIHSKPMSVDGDREVAAYQGTKEKPALNSMLSYPLYYTINRVFAQGQPTKYLGYKLDKIVNGNIYKDPYILANFVDNHDVSRFLRNSKPVALKQALTLLFTIPGIPVIYQGTEQMFSETRPAMFIGGNKKTNHFDEESEMYVFIKNLAQLRTNNKVFTRGDLKIIKDVENGPGILMYSRSYEGEQALVVFNTAEYPILTGNIQTDLQEGTLLKFVTGMGLENDLTVGRNRNLNFKIPAHSTGIFYVTNQINSLKNNTFKGKLESEIDNTIFEKDFVLEGKCDLKQSYQIVIDGNLNRTINLIPNKKGEWKTSIPISSFPFGESSHSLVLFSEANNQVSETYDFNTKVKIQGETTEIIDPKDDDFGPKKNYITPRAESYNGQMDITKVKVISYGGNLLLEIYTDEITDVWLPANGFDHASFHVFMDFPNKKGKVILPKLNANAPANFKWDYLFYMAGWNKTLYDATGSDKNNYGTIITPTPTISVDKIERKITIQFSPDVFGNQKDLNGLKIYITTWDSTGGEDGFVKISKKGGEYEFGGTDETNPPLIIDDTKIIEISKAK